MKYSSENVQNAFDDLRDCRMTDQERRARKAQVVSFMKKNPLPEVEPQESSVVLSVSESSWFAFAARPLAMALLVIALGFGGVVLAAEGSLPSDSLYAVKTKVNEPLRGAFAVSPLAKAQWQQDLAERRVSEAIALSNTMTITPEQQIKLVQDFQKHVEKSKEFASLAVEDVAAEVVEPVTREVEESPSEAPAVFEGQSLTVASDEELQREFVERLKVQRDIIAGTPNASPDAEVIIAVLDQEIASLDVVSVEAIPEDSEGEEQTDVSEQTGDEKPSVEDSETEVIVVQGDESESDIEESTSKVEEEPVEALLAYVFTSDQRDALEKLGIDLAEFPEELDTNGISCFESTLGTARSAKIFEGTRMNLFDVLKVSECFSDPEGDEVNPEEISPEVSEEVEGGEEETGEQAEEAPANDETELTHEDESQTEPESILEVGLLEALKETL